MTDQNVPSCQQQTDSKGHVSLITVQSQGTSGSEHIQAKNQVGAKVGRSLSSESILVEEFEHCMSRLVEGLEATNIGQGEGGR